MKTITIDVAALATIVQELAAENLDGVGTIFMNGRADGVACLHRRLLSLAREVKSAPPSCQANSEYELYSSACATSGILPCSLESFRQERQS